MISTFTLADAKARHTIMAIMARDAILQHSTQYWLDVFSDPATLQSPQAWDNYLRIAREFARREMRAIDLMHADLCRAASAAAPTAAGHDY